MRWSGEPSPRVFDCNTPYGGRTQRGNEGDRPIALQQTVRKPGVGSSVFLCSWGTASGHHSWQDRCTVDVPLAPIAGHLCGTARRQSPCPAPFPPIHHLSTICPTHSCRLPPVLGGRPAPFPLPSYLVGCLFPRGNRFETFRVSVWGRCKGGLPTPTSGGAHSPEIVSLASLCGCC